MLSIQIKTHTNTMICGAKLATTKTTVIKQAHNRVL